MMDKDTLYNILLATSVVYLSVRNRLRHSGYNDTNFEPPVIMMIGKAICHRSRMICGNSNRPLDPDMQHYSIGYE